MHSLSACVPSLWQAGDVKKALKRQGHSSKTPWNHFENFDRGLDRSVALTATMIAQECGAEWGNFNVGGRILPATAYPPPPPPPASPPL